MNIQIIKCDACGGTAPASDLGTWGVVVKNQKFEKLFCPTCTPMQPSSTGVVKLNGGFVFDQPPIKANFHPVKTADEIRHFRQLKLDDAHWSELEIEVRGAFQENSVRLNKLTVHNGDFKDLWVKFVWSEERLMGLEFAGDVPRLAQDLDIYQKHRLRLMGLVESSNKNRIWSISLTPAETSGDNVGRIISHVLQFGYFLKSHKTQGFVPTLL